MGLYNDLKSTLQFDIDNSVKVGYIMPDGKFLDLEKNAGVINPEESSDNRMCHWKLDIYLSVSGLTDQCVEKSLISSDNAVCINDGSIYTQDLTYFILPEEELTDEQYDALEDWLGYVKSKSDIVHLISARRFIYRRYEYTKQEDDGLWTPNEIIKDIKHFYVGGHFTYE